MVWPRVGPPVSRPSLPPPRRQRVLTASPYPSYRELTARALRSSSARRVCGRGALSRGGARCLPSVLSRCRSSRRATPSLLRYGRITTVQQSCIRNIRLFAEDCCVRCGRRRAFDPPRVGPSSGRTAVHVQSEMFKRVPFGVVDILGLYCTSTVRF